MPLTKVAEVEKKTQILREAKKLFFQLGFSKTNMTDIARACDLAKPTLYYYYPSKEAIFDEVVLEEAQQMVDCIEENIPQNAPADEQLRLFFNGLSEGKLFYAQKFADAPAYLRDHSPHGNPIVDKMKGLFVAKLIKILQNGVDQEIFNIKDVQLTAHSISLMKSFASLDWMNYHEDNERNELLETINNMIINGLKRRD